MNYTVNHTGKDQSSTGIVFEQTLATKLGKEEDI